MRGFSFLGIVSVGLLFLANGGLSAPVFENNEVVDVISSSTCRPIELDFGRYLGKWYEIGRSFFFIFGVGCKCTTAEYSSLDDGEIGIKNSCIQFGKDVVINGVGNATEGSLGALEVEFKDIPFSGKANYNVLWVDDDYKNAIVASCDLPFVGYNVWILSREKDMGDDQYKEMLNKIKDLGFNTWMIIKTDQTNC